MIKNKEWGGEFDREPGLLKKNGDFCAKCTIHEIKNSIDRFNRRLELIPVILLFLEEKRGLGNLGASSVENITTEKQNKRIEGTEKSTREIWNICVLGVPGQKKRMSRPIM